MPGDWAKEQLNELLNDVIDMASRLIVKHGTNIPFAVAIHRSGERMNIVADDSVSQDSSTLASTVLSHVREICAKRDAIAVAFARNVEYKDAKNGNRVDAIEISLDHSSADAVTCYLPYSIDRFNRFEPGELFAITKPVETFFKPIEL